MTLRVLLLQADAAYGQYPQVLKAYLLKYGAVAVAVAVV
jgi:hypothetical protein